MIFNTEAQRHIEKRLESNFSTQRRRDAKQGTRKAGGVPECFTLRLCALALMNSFFHFSVPLCLCVNDFLFPVLECPTPASCTSR